MTNYMDFPSILLPRLVAEGFRPANFKALTAAAPPVLMLLKQDGSVFYAVNIYLLAEASADFAGLKQKNDENLRQFQARADIRYFYSYNVLITRTPQDALTSFVKESEDYYGQPFYELNYAVTTDDGGFYSAENQPQDLTPVRKILYDALTKKDGAPMSPVDNLLDVSDTLSRIKPKTKTPYLTYGIIAINAVMLLLMELSGSSQNSDILMNFGAMNFDRFLAGEYYRVFTAMFLHIGMMHFFYNSLSLYIFGARIERHYGRLSFVVIYILSGLAGNFFNALLEPAVVLAGASAAIFGLMGAAIAITQVTRKHIDGLNFYTMLIFVLTGVLLGFSMPDIGNAAHVGGLAAGYLAGMVILKGLGRRKNDKNTRNVE